VVSDLAQVHRSGTAGQFLGQQSEAADRLRGSGFPFSFGIGSLAQLRAE